MNLEQFLFGAVLCAGIGVLAGVLGKWWAGRDNVKQMEDWQTELVDRELDAQGQLIQAQRERNEAQMLRESAKQHHEQTKQLVRQMRQELHQAAYEAVEFNDEMADTLLTLEPVTDLGTFEVTEDPDHPGMGYVSLPDREPVITAVDDTVTIEVTSAQVDAARLLIERGKTSSAIEQIANAETVVR